MVSADEAYVSLIQWVIESWIDEKTRMETKSVHYFRDKLI